MIDATAPQVFIPMSTGEGLPQAVEPITYAQRVAGLLALPPDAWTPHDLQLAGVDESTARVLIDELRRTPHASQASIYHGVARTQDVDTVFAWLRDGLRPPAMGHNASPRGAGTAIAVLLGLAIWGEPLGDLRLDPEAGNARRAESECFAVALLDIFMGRTRVDPDGVADVATTLAIVLACGARIDTTALGGVPPLIYAICRNVPVELLQILMLHRADPNERVAMDRAYGAPCGLDYLPGGTAMHHAALAGRADVMRLLHATDGARLDMPSDEGYDPLAVAGAYATPILAPRAGLIEGACPAIQAWLLPGRPEGGETSRNGEFMAEVLATRLLESGSRVAERELITWLGAMRVLCERGYDVAATLRRSPPQGGASYVARIQSALEHWHGGDAITWRHSPGRLSVVDVSVAIRRWLSLNVPPLLLPPSSRSPASTVKDNAIGARRRLVMRATQGPLFGDPPIAGRVETGVDGAALHASDISDTSDVFSRLRSARLALKRMQ